MQLLPLIVLFLVLRKYPHTFFEVGSLGEDIYIYMLGFFTLAYSAYFKEQNASCDVSMFAERLYRHIAPTVFLIIT